MNRFATIRRYLIYVAIALLALAVYWQVVRFEFVNYDDDLYVTKNIMVGRGLSFETVAWAFTTNWASNWHPLTWISHLVDVRLYHANPAGHHITSLLLHIANALLLLAVLSRMTRCLWRSAFVALLFAIHPLHVQSVVWVAERKDVLSALFWMLTMLAYVGYARQPRARAYLLTVLALAAGLMCKPMLVSLPVVLILLDYWPLDRLASCGWKRLIVEKLPLIALSAASSAVTYWAQASGGAVTTLRSLPFGVRLANASVAYAAYMVKMFWPAHLEAYYPHPGRTLPTWQVIGSSVLLALVTAAVIRLRKRAPYVIVGWLWYVITLVPVIGLVQVGDQAMADRYTYIPLVGLFIMIAWGMPDALAWRRAANMKALVAVGAIITLALVMCTYIQVGYWRNSLMLFKHAMAVDEHNYIACSNYAQALVSQRDFDGAILYYKKALDIQPDYPDTLNGLGYALLQKTRFAESIGLFRRAIQLWPRKAEYHSNLGMALAMTHQPDEALAELEEAVRLSHGSAKDLCNLGYFMTVNGRYDEAVRILREAAALDRADPVIQKDLREAIAKEEAQR